MNDDDHIGRGSIGPETSAIASAATSDNDVKAVRCCWTVAVVADGAAVVAAAAVDDDDDDDDGAAAVVEGTAVDEVVGAVVLVWSAAR